MNNTQQEGTTMICTTCGGDGYQPGFGTFYCSHCGGTGEEPTPVLALVGTEEQE